MKKLLAVCAVLASLPGLGRAESQMRAPYASDSHYSECQRIVPGTDVGTCTLASSSNRTTGALVVDAAISSPDSAAGAHTLPAWGQAVSIADVLTGYHLKTKVSSITFTVTWHITRVATLVRGLPRLAWVKPVVTLQGKGVDCQCASRAASYELVATHNGRDAIRSLTLEEPGSKLSPGTYILQAGLNAQAGLQHTSGLTRTLIIGNVSSVSVSVTP